MTISPIFGSKPAPDGEGSAGGPPGDARHGGDPAEDLFDNCGRHRGEVTWPQRIARVRYGGESVDTMDVGVAGVIHGCRPGRS